eukprot:m.327992 g.327992  ORF g.327992 m.327992 type:complete len:246 (+) comp16497_c0_seq1:49-786(+)
MHGSPMSSACLALAAVVLAVSVSGPIAALNPKGASAAKLLHFNNDLTNTESQVSPFHHNSSDPYSEAVLRGSVAETQGLGVTTHLLSPGFCWVAWWPSVVAPPQSYDQWFRGMFGPPTKIATVARIFEYVLGGGDIIGEFMSAAKAAGERPSVTFRITDFQTCDLAPASNYGGLSKFLYEKTNDSSAFQNPKGFNATCCWEHKCPCVCNDGTASLILSDPAVLDDRRSLMLEILDMSVSPVDICH